MHRVIVDQLRRIQPVAVLFDIDGTLAPIAVHPGQVRIASAMLGALDALCARCDGAIGILTGRPLAQTDVLLAARPFAVAAEHGAILRTPCGAVVCMVAGEPDIDTLYACAVADAAPLPGVWVERKRFGIAIHYRAAPAYAPQVRAMANRLAAGRSRMVTLQGKCVVEIQPSRVNKGAALRALLVQRPFQGRRPVVFGDDHTDEAAFLQAQRLGGLGVKIGPEQSCAAVALRSQAELLPLLRQWLSR